ncbi:putative HNHc nuclease [Paenilisteria newyorkensis]|uniref:putative HNHc nuclease n=1 Tax=Listeria newyorkensis TaxID=1497681 RepID=UPI000B0E4D99|nr:putative HNHc nuclease [Listeria newyorkensis]
MTTFAKIRDVREKGGRQLVIVEFDEPMPKYQLEKMSPEIEIQLHDGRRKSPGQNKLIHALLNEITVAYVGPSTSIQRKIDLEYTKSTMKAMFADELGRNSFSVGKANMTEATDFIEYLINFCIREGIELKNRDMYKDYNLQHWSFCCLIHGKCAISGVNQGVEKHHAKNLVGMGRNRRNLDHLDSYFISLSAVYHEEAHKLGWTDFSKKYHVECVKLSTEWIKKLGISR